MFWKRFWQIWFIITFFTINSYAFKININDPSQVYFLKSFHTNIFDIANHYLQTLSLIGLWGFALNLKLFGRKFWRFFLLALVLFHICYAFIYPIFHISSFHY
jgi:hypothetical protein